MHLSSAHQSHNFTHLPASRILLSFTPQSTSKHTCPLHISHTIPHIFLRHTFSCQSTCTSKHLSSAHQSHMLLPFFTFKDQARTQGNLPVADARDCTCLSHNSHTCTSLSSLPRTKLEHKDLLSMVDTRTIAHLLLRAEGGAISTNPELEFRCVGMGGVGGVSVGLIMGMGLGGSIPPPKTMGTARSNESRKG